MRNKARQTGQAVVEFVVIFALFSALLLGLFEMTRVFRAKHTLNTATFSAARAGALNNARQAPMNAELENGMSLLYMQGGSSVADLAAGVLRARAMGTALSAVDGGVHIVSPTQAVFNKFRRTQYLQLPAGTDHDYYQVIPNDNLRWRPRETKTIDVEGQAFDINLQDANLLKVRSVWCYRLIVPGLDRIIFEIVNTPIFMTTRQLQCSGLSIGGPFEGGGIPSAYYMAISSDATVRMQSPIVRDDLP